MWTEFSCFGYGIILGFVKKNVLNFSKFVDQFSDYKLSNENAGPWIDGQRTSGDLCLGAVDSLLH
jgi:hypothetical protein